MQAVRRPVAVPVFFIVTVRVPVEGAPGGRTRVGAADWLTTDASIVVVICHHDERRPSEYAGQVCAL